MSSKAREFGFGVAIIPIGRAKALNFSAIGGMGLYILQSSILGTAYP